MQYHCCQAGSSGRDQGGGAPIRQNNLAIGVGRVQLHSESTHPPTFSRLGLFVRAPNVMTSRRQPLMETSDNTATSSPAPTSSARRSGRVTKAPTKFTPDAPAATKRKRNPDHDDEDAENESPDEMDDVSDANDDDADDTATEEPRRAAKKKKSAASQPAKARKPALKKPKTNGDAPAREPIHSAQLPSRPKKTARIAIAQGDAEGLYGVYSWETLCCAVCGLLILTKQPTFLPLETLPTGSRRNGTTSTRRTSPLPSPISSTVSSGRRAVTSRSPKTISETPRTAPTD